MKKAFTLAEVLITLMIIGIVAALTIPSVISNYQQQEFKTGLKKAVSVLNEAIQTNIALDGETPYETDDLFAYLQKHMSIIKYGRTEYSSGSGGSPDETGRGWRTFGANLAFYTADGMRYEIASQGHFLTLHESGMYASNDHYRSDGGIGTIEKCGSYGLDNNPNNTKKTPCAILVDVNGDKKPNPVIETNKMYGSGHDAKFIYPSPSDKKITDVFNILITEDKAIPFGVVAQRAMYSK